MIKANMTSLRMKKNSRFCDKRCAAYRKKIVNEFGYPFHWRNTPTHPIEHDITIRMLLPYMEAETYSALGQVSRYMCSTLFDRVVMKEYKKILNRMEGECDRRIIRLKRNIYKHVERPLYQKSQSLYSPLRTLRSIRWERASDIAEATSQIDAYHAFISTHIEKYIKQRELLNRLETQYSDLHFSGMFLRYYLEGKRFMYL